MLRLHRTVPWLALSACCPTASAPPPTVGGPFPDASEPRFPADRPSAETALEATPIEAPFEPGKRQLAVHADEIGWKPCPPGLPASCAMAVLEGNPQRAQLYTIRIRSDEPLRLPPHRHPGNERMTVLSGTVFVGFGTTFDPSKCEAFEAGDYYVNRAGMVHYVWSEGPVAAQITGIGPWVVEPAAAAE